MTAYKLIVFDLEGTLLDSMKFIMDVIHTFLDKEVKAISDTVIKKNLGLSIPKFIEAIFPQYTLEEKNKAEKLYCSVYENFLSKRTYKLFDGVEIVLKELIKNKFLIAIASNAPERVVHDILSEVGLSNIFHSVVTSSHANPKPSPDMLLYLIKTHNLLSNNVLMVGDSISDINCAKAANVDSMCVTYNGVFDADDIKKINPSNGFLHDIKDLPKTIIFNHKAEVR